MRNYLKVFGGFSKQLKKMIFTRSNNIAILLDLVFPFPRNRKKWIIAINHRNIRPTRLLASFKKPMK